MYSAICVHIRLNNIYCFIYLIFFKVAYLLFLIVLKQSLYVASSSAKYNCKNSIKLRSGVVACTNRPTKYRKIILMCSVTHLATPPNYFLQIFLMYRYMNLTVLFYLMIGGKSLIH